MQQVISGDDSPSAWAHSWQLRTRRLHWPTRPLVMGIVNVTPDSFSDGGKFLAPERAIAHALQLVQDGADLLDIGGESTRPYATPVSESEELSRVVPVIEAIRQQTDIPISIDTSKGAVAAAAVEAGAEIINDVTGLTGDPRMLDVALRSGAGLCIMHMRGTPQTMQDNPTYGDVVGEVLEYLRDRRDQLVSAGVPRDRICVDPGIGFGKTHAHNLELMRHAKRFHELSQPVLVGHSRKGFLAKLIGDANADRTAATLGASLALACQGIQILRVHDVRATRHGWSCFAAGWPEQLAAPQEWLT
ncbi:MAG: dihydropteroate synthase [Pirellulales bacterium]